MNRQSLSRIILATIALLALLLVASSTAHAQGPAPVKLRVEITDAGFQPDTLEVQQGQAVELTFVWNQKASPNDEHILTLDGYKLESDKIDSDHRETTLKFIADKPGSFVFKCDLDCQAHDFLQAGHLKVTAGSSSSGSASLSPTKLSISPSSWVTAGDPIILMAVLKDDKGKPISKAQVQFSVDAQFASGHGPMQIGTAQTDRNGVAFLPYRPTLRTMLQKITAQFDGVGMYAGTSQSIEIRLIGTPASAYEVQPVGLPDMPAYASIRTPAPNPVMNVLSWTLGHWQEAPLVLLIAGVWLAFAFVLFQAFGIAWVRERG